MPYPSPLLAPSPLLPPGTEGNDGQLVLGEYAPRVSEVATLLRARTKDNVGNEIGNFTEATRPNADEVQLLIKRALGMIGGRIGADIPNEVIPSAKSAVAIQTAMLIELSYFPEQITLDRSAYNALRDMLAEEIKVVMEAVSEAGLGGDGDSVTAGGGMPSYGFPLSAAAARAETLPGYEIPYWDSYWRNLW